jgi:hypothetical protein
LAARLSVAMLLVPSILVRGVVAPGIVMGDVGVRGLLAGHSGILGSVRLGPLATRQSIELTARADAQSETPRGPGPTMRRAAVAPAGHPTHAPQMLRRRYNSLRHPPPHTGSGTKSCRREVTGPDPPKR